MLHERLTPVAASRAWATAPRDLIVSARPRQWIKNGFVFAALIFASRLGQPGSAARAVAAFALFSLLSSSLYLFNDVVDRAADRQHPLKAIRPVAAGRLSPSLALGVAAAGLVAGLGSSVLLDREFAAVAAGYVVLTSLYNLYLKHLVLIDVFAIAGGFVLRAVAGAVVIHVEISPWLYLCTMLLALLLGFGKRRHELLLLAGGAAGHRRNLDQYTGPLLDDLINIVSASTIVAYSMYTFFATALPHNHAMMVTIPLVAYGVFRYLLLVHRTDFAGAPEEAVWRDPPLLVDLVLWAGAAVMVLHLYR